MGGEGAFDADNAAAVREARSGFFKAIKDQSNHLATPKAKDWHAQHSPNEPRCAANQWRTRDRDEVLFMSEMEDRHLGHCIRFARTKPQHASRLSGLLTERATRQEPKP